MNMRFESIDFQDSESLYLQISDIIENKVKNKEIPVGGKIPSLRDLCKEFGVSIFTVREAISKLVNEGYLFRRENHGTFVVSSKPKKNVDLKRKNEIAVLVCPPVRGGSSDDIFSQYRYQKIIGGLEDRARENGLYLIYSTVKSNNDKFLLIEKQKDIAGLILIGEITPKIFRLVKSSPAPFVLIGDVIQEKSTDNNVDIITDDDFKGTHLATKHLIDLGHKRIGYVANSFSEYPWLGKKLKGYESALKEAGIICDKDLEVETGGNGNVEETFTALRKIIDKSVSFTALVCFSPTVCLGSMNAIKNAGMRIPEDVSIVGAGAFPGLTEVTYDLEDLGKLAVDRLIERLTNSDWEPKRIIIPHKLIDHGSTRRLETLKTAGRRKNS